MAKETSEGIDNDVQIIRQILFGEQMKAMQGKIEAMEKEIGSLKRETSRLQKELQAEQESRHQEYQSLDKVISSAQAENKSKLIETEEKLIKRVEGEGNTISQALSEAQGSLNAKIDQLSNQTDGLFAEHDRLHENLISSLASALVKFQAK